MSASREPTASGVQLFSFCHCPLLCACLNVPKLICIQSVVPKDDDKTAYILNSSKPLGSVTHKDCVINVEVEHEAARAGLS